MMDIDDRRDRLFPFSGDDQPQNGAYGQPGGLQGALTAAPDLRAIAQQLHGVLIARLDTNRLDTAPETEARRMVEEATASLLLERPDSIFGEERERLIRIVADEVLGLGPIQPLLDDPDISEVMVNGAETIYFERDGVLHESHLRFANEEHVRRIADRILGRIGRRVDEGTPMVDARLADGSRVNITIPPATPEYTTVTIRKFRSDRYRMDELMAAGTLNEAMLTLLQASVRYRLNILISGGTGSGKTTLLNALSAAIPPTERVITIEDPAELSLQQPHVVSMESRPPDMMGHHAITQRDLLRNALRMRPDRIVIGEIRGAEAFEMLQAMNTGHEGSLSTVHANTPRDALARVENMVLMTGVDLPVTAIREQMAAALHLVIQIHRFPDGSRKIVKISEVTGMEGARVTMHDLFVFQSAGLTPEGEVIGTFRPTGLRPTFAEEIEAAGGRLDPQIFLGEYAP